MKTKRILAGLAAVLLLFSSVSGCARKAEDVKIPAQADSDMAGNMYKTGYPIVKDKANLSVAASKRVQHLKSFKDFIIFKELEEKTNISVNWLEYPTAQKNEKTKLAFASNDLPDIFLEAGASVNMYGNNGQLIPLEGLIDKWGPNIKKATEHVPGTRNYITDSDTGHIYGLNQIRSEFYVPLNVPDMYINKKWLDAVGMKVPQTTDEFYLTLKAFKEKDPNKNGKADEIPFSFCFMEGTPTYSYVGVYNMFSPFGVEENNYHLVVRNNKLVYTFTMPEFKEGIEYLYKLYSQGLIDPESFTYNRSQYFASGKAKEMGVIIGHNSENTVGAAKAKDYEFIPVLKGPKGEPVLTKDSVLGELGMGPAITARCKIPEVAMRWLDSLYEEEMAAKMAYGPVGRYLKISSNSNYKYEFNNPPEGKSADDFCYEEAYGALYLPAGLVSLNPQLEEKKQREKLKAPYFTKNPLPPFSFNEKETSEIQVLKADIDTYVMKSLAKCVTTGNIDKEWEQIQQQLKKMGIDRLVELYQKAYDNTKK